MNWKFRKRKKISALDIEYLDNANIKAQECIAKLEKYHKLFCPIVKKNDGYNDYHNELLSDAIIEKIKSIRGSQAETTLI